MHRNKALFFSAADGKKDTLKVMDFNTKSISSYLFNFKQPKIRLHNLEGSTEGYTHPEGHFIDLMDEKLLVLSNTVEGSFIYEVEY